MPIVAKLSPGSTIAPLLLQVCVVCAPSKRQLKVCHRQRLNTRKLTRQGLESYLEMSFLRPEQYFSENKARKTFRHIEITVAHSFTWVSAVVGSSFTTEPFRGGIGTPVCVPRTVQCDRDKAVPRKFCELCDGHHSLITHCVLLIKSPRCPFAPQPNTPAAPPGGPHPPPAGRCLAAPPSRLTSTSDQSLLREKVV